MNSANFPALIGPVKCRACGWDDDGELRVVDAREELVPVWVPAGPMLAVWGDDPREHTPRGLALCPVCDEDFSDPSTMERRDI